MTAETVTHTIEQLLTEHDVARLLKVSVATIRRRRLLRLPPFPVKIGSSVRYKPSSIAMLIADSRSVDEHQAEATR
jgi:predicted DNA-binding transcriptional regulator AlpA